MTPRIVAALVALMVMGMWFNSTRPMAITAAAILTFMYPLLLVPLLVAAAFVFWRR